MAKASTSNTSTQGPPDWFVVLCKRLWTTQKLIWRTGLALGVLASVLAALLFIQWPWTTSKSLDGTLFKWFIQNPGSLLIAGLFLLLLILVIYLGSRFEVAVTAPAREQEDAAVDSGEDQGGRLVTDSDSIGNSPPQPSLNPKGSDSFFETVSELYECISEKLKVSEEQEGKYILPKVHGVFFGTSFGPTSCERARDELQGIKIPTQRLAEFIDSDNANILKLSSAEVHLRNSIRQPVHESRDILNRLQPLIEKFIPISRSQSRDMMTSLQEIQRLLRVLERDLNAVRGLLDNFKKK